MAAKRGARNGILSLAIKDKAVLYAAYMPFIRNGGLFIPTKKDYQLGDEVFMLLNLMDEAEKLPVAGKVVWVHAKRRRLAPRPPVSACSSTIRTMWPDPKSKPISPAPCSRTATPTRCSRPCWSTHTVT